MIINSATVRRPSESAYFGDIPIPIEVLGEIFMNCENHCVFSCVSLAFYRISRNPSYSPFIQKVFSTCLYKHLTVTLPPSPTVMQFISAGRRHLHQEAENLDLEFATDGDSELPTVSFLDPDELSTYVETENFIQAVNFFRFHRYQPPGTIDVTSAIIDAHNTVLGKYVGEKKINLNVYLASLQKHLNFEPLNEIDYTILSYRAPLTLTRVPAEIERFTALQELMLGCYKLQFLPDEFSNLTTLTTLHLNANSFSYAPNQLQHLTNLTFLNLCANQMTSLPLTFNTLQALTTLHLGSNQFEQIPGCIFSLTQLKELHLENNHISSLPDSISQLQNLRSFDLNGNHLEILPPSFCQLTNLRALYLARNLLPSLPEEFGQFGNLYCLSLLGTPLTSLPEEFGFLHSLHMLYLYDTKLPNPLPTCLGDLFTLQQIEIDDGQTFSKAPPNATITFESQQEDRGY